MHVNLFYLLSAVEWSKSQNFRPLAGEVIINEIHSLEHAITGLDSGVPYYVKVTAWNIKGFGRSSLSDPLYAIPSSELSVWQIATKWIYLHEVETSPFKYTLLFNLFY